MSPARFGLTSCEDCAARSQITAIVHSQRQCTNALRADCVAMLDVIMARWQILRRSRHSRSAPTVLRRLEGAQHRRGGRVDHHAAASVGAQAAADEVLAKLV